MPENSQTYSIYFYKTSSGREIIIDFIESLDLDTKARVRNTLRLLEEQGLELLQHGWVKKIYHRPSLFELRIIGPKQIRILFISYENRVFIITHIFHKKTQKTPAREIKLAIKRAKEFIETS